VTGARLSAALAATALAWLAASCAEPRAFEWRLRFSRDSIRARAESVTATIVAGGCGGGRTVYEEQLTVRDAAPRPPVLEAGIYGFAGVARSDTGAIVADGCTERAMPAADGLIVTVLDGDEPPDPDADVADGDVAADAADPDAAADADADAAASDADGLDASPDADGLPPTPAAPRVIAPWNGATTGSARAEGLLLDHPLRPEVRWAASPGAASYVLELVPCDERDLRRCDFASPAARVVTSAATLRARPAVDLPVATDPPVGSRYAFRVGACADASGRVCDYSPPRYVDVGRLRQDVDGDGTGDVFAVGETASGDRRLFRSRGAFETVADPLALSSAQVGAVAWIGDYDADGYAEVAAGVGGVPGGAWVFLDGLAEAGSDEDATDGTRLGAAIAGLDDVDGDGYADFAVTAPGRSEVRVQLGGATFDAARSVVVRAPAGTTEFPSLVASAGDRDGDGLADLAVVGRVGPDTKRVHVFSLAGRIPRAIFHEDVGTGEVGFDPVSFSLGRAVDVDDDGVADIPVGRPLYAVTTVLFAGDRDAADGFGESFGTSVYGGDLDGTGRGRIVVGAPAFVTGGGRGTGATYHVARTADSFAGTQLVYLDEERFGQAVVAVDVDGDGREDVVSLGDAAIHVGCFDEGAGAIGGGSYFILAAPSGASRWRGLVQ
jgi:hypothetical protein